MDMGGTIGIQSNGGSGACVVTLVFGTARDDGGYFSRNERRSVKAGSTRKLFACCRIMRAHILEMVLASVPVSRRTEVFCEESEDPSNAVH